MPTRIGPEPIAERFGYFNDYGMQGFWEGFASGPFAGAASSFTHGA